MNDPAQKAMSGAAPPAAEATVKVLVVDDHPVWRDGIRADLEREGIHVVGEAGDGAEAVEVARSAMPDVVLMDLHLPTVSGVEATRRIVEDSPHVRVLVLTASGEESDVVEAILAGASGYLLKSSRGSEVARGVRDVHGGQQVVTQSVAGLLLDRFRQMGSGGLDEPALTPRENEILKYVAKGYTYKEIADRLFISVKTVQNHVQNILSKLQLRKRYELMRYAIKKGLDRGPE